MFGLASLQMAQSLRTHVRSVRLGGPGLQVPDASSSSAMSPSVLRSISTHGNESSPSSSSSSSSGRNGPNFSKRGGGGDVGKDCTFSRFETQSKVHDQSSYHTSKDPGTKGTSTAPTTAPTPPTGKRLNEAVHTFSWRDFIDIVVRWRQVSL